MPARIRKARDEKDDGFTLIELLVVIIIIGILAAIAIPVFLNQRKKGYDAQAKSDLKNASTLMETYFIDFGAYPDNGETSKIKALGYNKSANTSEVAITLTGSGAAASYMLTSQSDSTDTFCFNSARAGKGIVKATSC